MAQLITTIGLDADDTLWHNEQLFKLTEVRFADMLNDHGPRDVIRARLIAAERRNLSVYGYGVKGFMLSMIETAHELAGGNVPGALLAEILKSGRDMLNHPVEPLPHVVKTLAALHDHYRLVLVTKGDLFDQERKVAQSGLAEFFQAVEIVSEKTPAVYARVFAEHGDGPGRALMAGNSLKSDVVPALAAGSWAVHVPHELLFELERHDGAVESERFREIAHLGELPELVAAITTNAP